MSFAYGLGLCNVHSILRTIGNSSKNFSWPFLKNTCSGVGSVSVDESVRLHVHSFFTESFSNESVSSAAIE